MNLKENFKYLCWSRAVQELILYYPVFVPFAYSIGLSLEDIATYVIVVNVAVLLFEVPSGVLADRWSRKGTILVAIAAHALSILVVGTAQTTAQFTAGAFLWGVFYAMQSGTFDSIIYDLLKEHKKESKFKEFLAKFNLYGTAGLVVGSVLGGIIASTVGFRAAYFLTVIPSIIAVGLLLKVEEPKRFRQNITFNSIEHHRRALKQISKKGFVLRITLAMVLLQAAIGFLFELNQVYYVVAAAPLAIFGIYNASMQSSIGVGFWLAAERGGKRSLVVGSALFTVLAALVMVFVNPYSAALLSVMMMVLFFMVAILSHDLQDKLESEVRAAANSMVSSGGRLVFAGMALLLPIISNEDSVDGFIQLVALGVLLSALTISLLRKSSDN